MNWKWYERWFIAWLELLDALATIISFGNWYPNLNFKYIWFLSNRDMEKYKNEQKRQ